ncbi:MAG: hypothetical protein AAF657_39170 [Acidobacteriota bacterium]
MRLCPKFIALSIFLAVGTAEAQRLSSTLEGDVRPAKVQEELEKVESMLLRGKWKAGLRYATTLTEIVVGRMWRGREIRSMLTDLVVARAIAEANLGRRDEAVWHWHLAQNLSFRVRQRDLTPYGEAAKLLYEHPLRALGEVPPPFVVPESYPGGPRLTSPVRPEMHSIPEVVNNTGAALEGSGDFHVEILIDETGQFQHPVVISTHLHPIILYTSLEWLRRLPRFGPAKFEGEPVDHLEKITVRFEVSRW